MAHMKYLNTTRQTMITVQCGAEDGSKSAFAPLLSGNLQLWRLRNRPSGHLIIQHPPNTQGILIPQFFRQGCARKALVPNWTTESLSGLTADRSPATVGSGRNWTAVHHRMAHFGSGGK